MWTSLLGMTLAPTVAVAQEPFALVANLSSDVLTERLAAAGPEQQVQLLLVLADRNRFTPALAARELERARAVLASLPPPLATPAASAYADGLTCDLAYRTRDLVADIAACDRLSDHLQHVSDPAVRSTLWSILAGVRQTLGELPESLDLSRLALDAARQSRVPLLVARALMQRGATLNDFGLPEQALASLARARQTLQGEERPLFTMRLAVLMGASQVLSGQPQTALPSFLEALAWAEAAGAGELAVQLRDQIANAYLVLGQPQMALRYLEGVFAGNVKPLPAAIRISARTTLGRAYQASGAGTQANRALSQAISEAQAVQDRPRRQRAAMALARALMEQGQPTAALNQLEPLVAELQQAEPTLHLVNALEVTALAHADLDQYAEAYEARTAGQTLKSTLQSANFERALAFEQAELEVDRQANELTRLRAKEQSLSARSRLQSALLASLTALGVCGGLLVYLWVSRRLQRQAAQASELASQELESLVIARTRELENELANRLLLQEERRQLEAHLAEGDKLRTIGQLTSGVAHDFNNLMTVVTLSAELLAQDEQPLSKRQRQCVEDILLASESGSNVTTGLLAYARQQSLEPEPVDLAQYIEQSEPLFQRTLGEGIALTTRIEPVNLTIDKANLTTALINLLVNAREAMGGRGLVQLEVTRHSDHPGPHKHGAARNWARIRVTDTGRGMSATERSRAVEPFFTTKSGGKGSGLGLSMVYGFAKQSGGEIEIDAPAGGGAAITLWLPESNSEASPVVSVTLDAQPQIRSGTSVWLVEDQDALRETMQKLLESMGLQVRAIENADAAAALIPTQPAPDLLLSDVIMPGQRTGNELADEMRRRYPHLPVLLMSGYTDLVEIDYPMLQKPFSLDELRMHVAEALADHDNDTAQAS